MIPQATWLSIVLVAATQISGPDCMYRTPSASIDSALPTTLVTAMTVEPWRLASRTAAIVSAVSPDWEKAMTSVRRLSSGSP